MTDELQPVWTLVLTGPPGAGKSDTLLNWARQIPEGEVWTVITRGNAGVPVGLPTGAHVLALAHDCACCTGQVLLRTHLSRTLRFRRPHRLFIEAALDEHLVKTLSWLAGPAWTGWIGPVSCMALLPMNKPLTPQCQAIALTSAHAICYTDAAAPECTAPAQAQRLLAARAQADPAQWRMVLPTGRVSWSLAHDALGCARPGI